MEERLVPMAKLYRKPYFDASLFVAWIEGEVREAGDRSAIVDHIYRLARRGQFQIYTSSLTFAEVPGRTGQTTAEGEDDVFTQAFLAFMENEFFVVVDLDRSVGEEAHRLCHRYGLSPGHAVHLASADRAGCDVLLTWDPHLLGLDHPRVATEAPIMVGQLSMEIDTAQLRSFRQVPASEL
jgi:predicted nucleic acid-binding protein